MPSSEKQFAVPPPTDSVSSGMYTEDRLIAFGRPDEHKEFVSSAGAILRPRMARALGLSNLTPGMDVLDLGCGKGEMVVAGALRESRIWALDYAEGGLSLCRQSVSVLPDEIRSRVVLVRADAKAVPFPDASFDRVWVLDIAEHLQPWELDLTMREVHRILKPKGYAVIHTLPNRWALDIGYPCARRVLRNLPPSPRSEVERQVHVNEQTIVSLSAALRSAGLKCRVWLEGRTSQQAKWHGTRYTFPDARESAYSFLRHTCAATLYSILLSSVLRLVLANDIYAIAWKESLGATAQMPLALAERLLLLVHHTVEQVRVTLSGHKSKVRRGSSTQVKG